MEKLLQWVNWVYFTALIITVVAGLAIYQLSTRINAAKNQEMEAYRTRSEVEISKAQAAASAANERAAQADAVAEQAKLELAKLKQPRTISSSHQSRMVNDLAEYAGQTYSYIAYEDSEAHALLMQIDSVLRQAGWRDVPSWKTVTVRKIALNTVGTSAKSGVSVYMGPNYPEGERTLLALSDSLTKAGIPCTPNRDANWGDKEPRTIVIEVGKKPVN